MVVGVNVRPGLVLLLPLLLLCAVGAGVALVFLRPPWLPTLVLSLVIGAGFLWALVGVFWPNRVDRTCPACGSEALTRVDPRTTLGLRCTACEHVDPTASGWFLAEEEGSLEDLVLRQRGRSARTGSR